MAAKYYAMELIHRGFVLDDERVGSKVGWEQEDWLVIEAWKDRDGDPGRWWVRAVRRDRGRNDGRTVDATTYVELTLERETSGTCHDAYATFVRAPA